MKVCLITTNLPPVRCGVGDYTIHLGNTLVARGDEVVLLTGQTQASAVPGARFTVKNMLPSWGLSGMPQLWRAIRAERPDVVMLQWVPFLYSRTGTNLALPFTLALLAATGVRLHVMVHEPWVRFIWWSYYITGPLQRVALGTLIVASDRVSVSITRWRDMLAARFPWKSSRIGWVPVGSNIPVVPVADPTLVRDRAGIPRRALLIGVFSLSGAAKAFDLIEAAWRTAAGQDPNVHVVLIGASNEQAAARLPGLAGDVRCHVTGELPAADVSAWLQTVDLLLAPFSDGMSSRRTSVIAAMNHGVPVVTTRGRSTDQLFETSPLLMSAVDDGAFAQLALTVCRDAEQRRSIGQATRAFHDEHFAWDTISEMLLPAGGADARARVV